MAKTKPHQFPESKNFAAKDTVIFCSREKILELYNHVSSTPASYYSAKVQAWFAEEAVKHDWLACLPVRNVDTPSRFEGCILFNGHAGKLDTGNRKIILDHNLLYSDGESEDFDAESQVVDPAPSS